jgi:hypothetical protein
MVSKTRGDQENTMQTKAGATAEITQAGQREIPVARNAAHEVGTRASENGTPVDPRRADSSSVLDKQLQRWINEGGALGARE